MPNLSKNYLLVAIIIILHLVGAVGTLIPSYSSFIISLTPLNLIISAFILLMASEKLTRPIVYSILVCFVLGFVIEVVGVQTGWPFGEYYYGSVLGYKLFGVPLLIGVNWFILSFAFYSLTKELQINLFFKSALVSLGMVALDLLIEPVAITLGYWYWTSQQIPIENYIAWFGIAYVLQLLLNLIGARGNKQVSAALLTAQCLYFCIVFLLKG